MSSPDIWLFAALGLLFFVFAVLALLHSRVALWAVLLSTVVSIDIFTASVGGIEGSSVHKLAILIGAAPFAYLHGTREWLAPPMKAFAVMLATTYVFASWHPALSTIQPLKTFVGLAIPWLFYSIRWDGAAARELVGIVVRIPVIVLALGMVFHISGIHPLFRSEYTGVARLQGSMIPAHLAMLAYLGFVIALIEAARGRDAYWKWMAINFVILAATGTRGATLAGLVMIGPLVLDRFRGLLRGRASAVLPLFGVPAVLGGVLLANWSTFVQRTMAAGPDAGVINTSGRLVVWLFYITEGLVNPAFGRGLGAGAVANQGDVNEAFRVPHNEYIRIFVDGGLLGLVLVLAAFLVVFGQVRKSVEPESRAYFGWFFASVAVYAFFDNLLFTIQFLVPFAAYLGIVRSEGERSASLEKRSRTPQVHAPA